MPEIFDTPAIAAETQAFLDTSQRLLINGEWVDTTSGQQLTVVNPCHWRGDCVGAGCRRGGNQCGGGCSPGGI